MADTKGRFLKEVKMDWDEIEKKVRAHRRKLLRRAAIIAACCVAGFAALYIGSQLKTYGEYKVIDSVERTDTPATRFLLFDGNILKYSNDGAFYTNEKSELIWNQTFEMQSPLVSACESYVAFADVDGQEIYILNTKGLQGTIDTNMPIQKIDVANQGTVAVLMSNKGTSYLALYNKEGDCLAEGALHIENSGYPMDIALTSDGKKLAVSILDVNSGSVKTTVSFYNFDSVGQNQIDNIVNTCSYADSVIPQLVCVKDNKILAFADHSVIIFDGAQKPEPVNEINISAEIKSVFYDDTYFGMILSEEGKETGRRLVVYDFKGSQIINVNVDISYDSIYFLKNHEVCVQSDEQCEIYTLHGIKKFKADFDEQNLYYVMSGGGVRNYTLLLEGSTEQIRGKFFSSTRQEEE